MTYKRVILESPFAGNRTANTIFARACIRDCALRGESAIASHLLYTQPGILKDEVTEERALGIALGLAWSGVADYHVFYTDRGWSNGMINALCHCLKNGHKFVIRGLRKEATLPPRLNELSLGDQRLVTEAL